MSGVNVGAVSAALLAAESVGALMIVGTVLVIAAGCVGNTADTKGGVSHACDDRLSDVRSSVETCSHVFEIGFGTVVYILDFTPALSRRPG